MELKLAPTSDYWGYKYKLRVPLTWKELASEIDQAANDASQSTRWLSFRDICSDAARNMSDFSAHCSCPVLYFL